MADRRLPLRPKFHGSGNPHIDEHDETTHAELFYDLFFVANLTIFTYIHDVSDGQALKQYVCFFCILWFTWYQVALHDVRFAKVDCFSSRVFKALQFGFMIAFAAVGPMFMVGEAKDERGRSIHHYLRALTLALMGSRLVLTMQYLLARHTLRDQQGARKPLLALGVTYAIAALIYGALFPSFRQDAHNYEWAAWYVVACFESIIATFANGSSQYLTFNDTHLVQRMSLLTLIILGEGAIALGKQCQVISDAATLDWNATNVGNIISSVLILYFLYMIYFDWIKERLQLNEYKQRFWACLHFPLHLALVLAVQGVSLCIIWGAAVMKVKQLDSANQRWVDDTNAHWENDMTNTEWQEAHYFWNSTAQGLLADQGYTTKSYAGAVDTMNDLRRVEFALPLFNTSVDGLSSARRAYDLVHYTSYLSVYSIVGFQKAKNLTFEMEEHDNFTNYGFNINDTQWDITGERSKYLADVAGKFHLTFIYLFISIGLVLLMCTALGALVLLSQNRKYRRISHWFRLGSAAVIGTTLCLLTTLAVRDNVVYARFISGSGLLPTIAVLLFLVALVYCLDLSSLHSAAVHYHAASTHTSHEVLTMEHCDSSEVTRDYNDTRYNSASRSARETSRSTLETSRSTLDPPRNTLGP